MSTEPDPKTVAERLSAAIANLGYPVGMGLPPSPDDVQRILSAALPQGEHAELADELEAWSGDGQELRHRAAAALRLSGGGVGVKAHEPQDMEFLRESGEVGDCVRASTATLLGLERSAVPHFVKEHSGGWRGPWADWLEARGLAVLELDPRLRPDCLFLACGPTVREGGDHPAAHMVVMDHLGLYHDPHPSRKGIVTVDRVYVVVPRALSPAPVEAGSAARGRAPAVPEEWQGAVASRIAVFRDMVPEEGETWESWYFAAFDLLADEVRTGRNLVLAAAPPPPAEEG